MQVLCANKQWKAAWVGLGTRLAGAQEVCNSIITVVTAESPASTISSVLCPLMSTMGCSLKITPRLWKKMVPGLHMQCTKLDAAVSTHNSLTNHTPGSEDSGKGCG